jgi:CRISPR-associated protein (TIGR03984 family)
MRDIKVGQSQVLTTIVNTSEDLHLWLETEANTHDLRWLLAHCYDGVIWGELRKGKLELSCEAFPERGLALRWHTLQQARLFSDQAELLIWPGPQKWQATYRNDALGERIEYIDEKQFLWGDHKLDERNGFVKIAEGSQGIVHAPPIGNTSPAGHKRASLEVRHYIGEDETGVARIVASRLVRLQ